VVWIIELDVKNEASVRNYRIIVERLFDVELDSAFDKHMTL